MKKNIILGGIFILSLMLVLGFVVAKTPVYELSQNYTGIQTSAGIVTLYAGTMLGGQPSNYATLDNQETFQTTVGPKTFAAGTMIDCDHAPGEPDPCDGMGLG